MKQNRTLKKAITLLMAFFMFAITGCQTGGKDAPTTEIITDEGKKEVPLVTLVTDVNWQPSNLRTVLNSVPGSGQEFQIEIETLPRTEPERSNRLTRMRTEMMAGKGPDLFIVDLEFNANGFTDTGSLLSPIFPFPEKAMKNRLFLPLDGYMENTITDFSAFLPALMETCRNDEGQQLIPLTFNFEVARFSTDIYDIPIESTGSREAMLSSGVPVLENFAGAPPRMPLGPFSADADDETDTLAFTEDELFEEAMLWRENTDGSFPPGFSIGSLAPSPADNYTVTESTRFIPARNRDGGVTAYVNIIGAVNRNSSYPDYAFSIIDIIASEGVMRDQTLYGWSGSIVANTELGTSDKPLKWLPMTGKSYEVYQELLDQIDVVKFPTLLEQAVYEEIYMPCVHQELETEADVRAAVHKAYMTMLMMLAES